MLPEKLTEKAVNTFKNRIVRELRHGIVSVIFFGSRQKGKFAPDSDIDILVVMRAKTPMVTNKIFNIADEVERGVLSYNIPLSVHIMSVEEYKKLKGMKSLFLKEVEEEGLVIYAGKTQS